MITRFHVSSLGDYLRVKDFLEVGVNKRFVSPGAAASAKEGSNRLYPIAIWEFQLIARPARSDKNEFFF